MATSRSVSVGPSIDARRPRLHHRLEPRLALVAVALACTALATTGVPIETHARPILDGTVTYLIGHDDQILADPERLGSIVPVESGFQTLEGRVDLSWPGWITRRDRLDVAAMAAGTRYHQEALGNDSDLRLAGLYRHGFASRWVVEGRAGVTRFRREQVPLFDLDRVRVGGLASWSSTSGWLVTFDAELAALRFPARLTADGSDIERDRRLDVAVGVSRDLLGAGFWGLEIGHRRLTSNEPLVEYQGPIAGLRVGLVPGSRSRIGLTGVFGDRTYADYAVIDGGGNATGAQRHDRTWQGTITGSYWLRAWLGLYAIVATTRQTSNIEAFAFDQLRAQAGVTIALRLLGRQTITIPGRTSTRDRSGTVDVDEVLAGAGADGGPEADPLTPQAVAGGYRFRHHAPDAHRVVVVGGFNDWDVERSPLDGPDAEGIWETVLPLPPGIWRYAIVVDGSWVTPQEAVRYEDDGYGGRNGILEVQPDPGEMAPTPAMGGG